MNKLKLAKVGQIFLLFCGTVFAWYIIIREFINFYANEGTIFKVTDCVYTNPVTTACFYGGIGFVVALGWAIYLFKKYEYKGRLYHTIFLLGGTLFAWSVVAWEWWKIKQAAGQPVVGCSGLMNSIFDSSCLYGASFFLISFLVGWYIFNLVKKSA